MKKRFVSVALCAVGVVGVIGAVPIAIADNKYEESKVMNRAAIQGQNKGYSTNKQYTYIDDKEVKKQIDEAKRSHKDNVEIGHTTVGANVKDAEVVVKTHQNIDLHAKKLGIGTVDVEGKSTGRHVQSIVDDSGSVNTRGGW